MAASPPAASSHAARATNGLRTRSPIRAPSTTQTSALIPVAPASPAEDRPGSIHDRSRNGVPRKTSWFAKGLTSIGKKNVAARRARRKRPSEAAAPIRARLALCDEFGRPGPGSAVTAPHPASATSSRSPSMSPQPGSRRSAGARRWASHRSSSDRRSGAGPGWGLSVPDASTRALCRASGSLLAFGRGLGQRRLAASLSPRGEQARHDDSPHFHSCLERKYR